MDVNPLTHSFVPIVFMVGMAIATGVGILVLSWFLGGGLSSHAGDTIYECGLDPMDEPNKKFPVKFYVVAMLFILFDVEIALLYPWAVFFGGGIDRGLRLFAFVELLVFTAVLVAGYVYLLRAGAFDWAAGTRQASRAAGGAGRRAA